jgi:hypothetical protein
MLVSKRTIGLRDNPSGPLSNKMPNFRKELQKFAFWALLSMHYNGKPGFDYIMYIFILLFYHTFLGDWSYDYTRLSCSLFTLK